MFQSSIWEKIVNLTEKEGVQKLTQIHVGVAYILKVALNVSGGKND